MKKIYFLGLSVAIFACKVNKSPETDYQKKADELAHKYIMVDGHVDLPYRLKVKNFQMQKEFTGIPVETKEGDFDYKRAKKGGLSAPFMSIYIPASYDTQGAQKLADSLITMVNYIATEKSDYFEVAKTPAEIREIFKKGKIALPMGMENGSPIGEVADVAKYRAKGISYITLSHGKDNRICDSSYDTTHTWKGLSPFGREVVNTMVKEGVLVDISHVSDDTFYQVVDMSPVPVIASHSSSRKFTPDFQRNMSDDMIAKLGKNGGVIMINFGSTFLSSEVSEYRKSLQAEIKTILDKKGLKARDQAAEPIIDEFFASHPLAFADVKKVADHIDNVVKLAGIDHVGIGSDFDGVGNSLPTGLKDVSDYPNLIAELLRRGYSESDIEKICSGNIFRVWEKVLAYAGK
ncbi:dipeptidase [Lacihabitans sp. CS3-21]|uniref:dipeptidase n=1 Tax=Lacihabitans sp. CS3-21 TaxID=2487332 RepID=UPI0020CBDD83|nr:dipeptidase [Lacihabitans sp. CS3-21]MCP9748615.1 membrane dipeptidase [Lacihabitans sp. CS3-21]